MGTMDLDLSGKVALVTGSSRGIGKSIAMAMAQKGAKVALCGRKQENLDQALEDFRKQGLQVMARTANLGQSAQVAALFSAVDEEFGGLDILVNNVGTNLLTPSVAEADVGLFDKLMETNLKSVFLASGEAVRRMKKRGGGKIINISSVAGRRASRGMGIYCIAKAAVDMLTKVLAQELAPDRINVNAIAPGVVRTKFSQPFWSNETLLQEIVRTIPMGRIAETSDVVGAALFLASGLSDYITGEIISVDGGSMV
jgi:NAD(P)-dependent dehydrogenase (short-subunit alcohol dehydrogenase family)